MTKLVPLQTKVSEECKKILREQKAIRRENIGKIIEDLVMEVYGNDDRNKNE